MLKHIIYVYEVDLIWVWSGWGILIISHSIYKWETEWITSITETSTLSDQISLWGWILMIPGQSGRCWNTLYIYKVNLQWVWSGWDAPITTHSMLQVQEQERNWVYLLPDQAKSGWGCILMIAGHSGGCWNTVYMYNKDLVWVWSDLGVSIIT